MIIWISIFSFTTLKLLSILIANLDLMIMVFIQEIGSLEQKMEHMLLISMRNKVKEHIRFPI